MAGMKAKYGDRICLKGNIDCTGALCDGTPEDVAEEVRQCILGGGPGGGFILSSSNTIHKGVKPENFRAMLAGAAQIWAISAAAVEFCGPDCLQFACVLSG